MDALSSTGVETGVDPGVEPLEETGMEVLISGRTGFFSGCFDGAMAAGLRFGSAGCIFAMLSIYQRRLGRLRISTFCFSGAVTKSKQSEGRHDMKSLTHFRRQSFLISTHHLHGRPPASSNPRKSSNSMCLSLL